MSATRSDFTPQKTTAVVLTALFCLWFGVEAAETNVAFPSFVATGHMVTQDFLNTEPRSSVDADFSFLFSNGWWEIEAKIQDLKPRPRQPARNEWNDWRKIDAKVQDVKQDDPIYLKCERTPEGIRSSFWRAENPAAKISDAQATSFPPPDEQQMFVPWLALSPEPQLPLIDDKRIYRLGSPEELLFNSQNQAFYNASYLAPNHHFLSQLSISNNGTSLEPNDVGCSNPGPPRLVHLPDPYGNGFLECRYQVLAMTNLNGLDFPKQAIYEIFVPYWGSQTAKTFRSQLADFSVDQITLLPGKLAENSQPPPRVEIHPVDSIAEYYRGISSFDSRVAGVLPSLGNAGGGQ